MGQFGAVTGIKRRPRYEDIINAETPYLPAQYKARSDRAYTEKADQFARSEAEKDRAAQDSWEHDQRKQQNRANNLGYANLATNILSNTSAFQDLYTSVMDTLFG